MAPESQDREGLVAGQGVTKRTYWTPYNCLPMILPHVSTARLEQPVEKIPVYFQKQIKAFRLCSANLSLKAAGKICSLPLSLTPRPLQVRTFRPASPPLSLPPPEQADPPTAQLVLVCSQSTTALENGDNGIQVGMLTKKKGNWFKEKSVLNPCFFLSGFLESVFTMLSGPQEPPWGSQGRRSSLRQPHRPHLLTRSTPGKDNPLS